MNVIVWLVLLGALLPFVASVISKAGGKGFDNANPRVWLANQQGWRGRANAAQTNAFESLPFFFVAVLLALHRQADLDYLRNLMIAWLLVRLLYLALYLWDKDTLRSLAWLAALILNILILFAA
jgi:uncharacterized MAPEG superfamily protein